MRRCHGDLHLRNICLFEGEPTLFDCIEFTDALASIDVLYDLAFLLMDLEHRGLPRLANLLLNRYLDRTGEDGGAGGAAAVHVPAGRHPRACDGDRRGPAKRPQKTQRDGRGAGAISIWRSMLLPPQPPRLIAIGGLSGTGKSTLAMGLAPDLGAAPGRAACCAAMCCASP